MANSYFQFKQFIVRQDRCAMKVTTDGCLLGAFAAHEISRSVNGSTKLHCLDIGTGTGLLALMLAQKINGSIDAIELDTTAAGQAKENIENSPYAEKISIIQADVKDYSFSIKYDVIISNPPFYENELKGNNPVKNMAHHSESLVLADLFPLIKNNLNPSGSFYLLLPNKRAEEAIELLHKNQLSITDMILVRPSPVHPVFRILLKGSQEKNTATETVTKEILIRNENQEYSVAFRSLLQDYYLHG